MSPKAISLCLAAVAIIVFGWKVARSNAYESAEYTVVEKENQFEVRKYPELVLAATKMSTESQRRDGSFMRLFGYISGANDSQQKVAMTTPVFMEAEPGKQQGQMGFVMPKKVADKGAPEPTSDQVAIRKRPAGQYAVIRFNGRMNKESVTKAEASLREWITDKGLRGAKSFESAGYDPPGTPARLRRNEVLVRLVTAEKNSEQAKSKEQVSESVTVEEQGG